MATTTGRPDRDDVEAQLSQLRADFAKLAETVNTMGRGKAEELRGRAAHGAEEVRHASEAAFRAAANRAQELEADVAFRVRERPFVALAIAAGLGFLAALLARR